MTLHQQARDFIKAVADLDQPGWHQRTPEEGRAVFAAMDDLFGDGPSVARLEDFNLGGQLNVRLYAANEKSVDQPVVIYFHGGGWVLGSIQTHDALCRQLAIESGFVVVSVDYGLSPENKFPGPLNDCLTAVNYVALNSKTLGIDPANIAVAGDSAGGNLAAAVAIKAQQQNEITIKFQLLIYPVIEPNFETESYQQWGDDYLLTTESMKWFWQQYLKSDDDAVNPLAAPARSKSLAGLPPAHIITAQYDPLRDEGQRYACLLTEAGVPTTQKEYEGMVHGFVHFRGVFDDGKRALTDIANELKKHLS